MSSTEVRKPLPPFTLEEAKLKVRVAEDAWNGKNPEKVALAYSPDSQWRNRDTFFNGRPAIVSFLTGKWQRELDYRLIKEIWAHSDNRIAVRFVYEYHNAEGKWFRAHGNENWQFDENGLMEQRHASVNDVSIDESERKFHWPQGSRPDDHLGLTKLGL